MNKRKLNLLSPNEDDETSFPGRNLNRSMIQGLRNNIQQDGGRQNNSSHLSRDQIDEHRNKIKHIVSTESSFKRQRNSAQIERSEYNTLEVISNSHGNRRKSSQFRNSQKNVLGDRKASHFTPDDKKRRGESTRHITLNLGLSGFQEETFLPSIGQTRNQQNVNYETDTKNERFKKKIYNMKDEIEQLKNKANVLNPRGHTRKVINLNQQIQDDHDYETENNDGAYQLRLHGRSSRIGVNQNRQHSQNNNKRPNGLEITANEDGHVRQSNTHQNSQEGLATIATIATTEDAKVPKQRIKKLRKRESLTIDTHQFKQNQQAQYQNASLKIHRDEQQMYESEGQGQIFKVNLGNMNKDNSATPADISPALNVNKKALDTTSFKLKPSQINFDKSQIQPHVVKGVNTPTLSGYNSDAKQGNLVFKAANINFNQKSPQTSFGGKSPIKIIQLKHSSTSKRRKNHQQDSESQRGESDTTQSVIMMTPASVQPNKLPVNHQVVLENVRGEDQESPQQKFKDGGKHPKLQGFGDLETQYIQNSRYQMDNMMELEPSLDYPSDDCGDGTQHRQKEDELFSGSDSSGASNRWKFKKKPKANRNAANEGQSPLKLEMRQESNNQQFLNEVMDLQSPEITKTDNEMEQKEKKTIYIDFKIKLNQSEPTSKKVVSRKVNLNMPGQLAATKSPQFIPQNRSFNVKNPDQDLNSLPQDMLRRKLNAVQKAQNNEHSQDPTTRSAQGSARERTEDRNDNAQNPDGQNGSGANGQKLSPEKLDKIKSAFQQKNKNKFNFSNKKLKLKIDNKPPIVKKKKKEPDVESSDATESVKDLQIGEDLGFKQQKNLNSTYCKEYVSKNSFNQKYKHLFTRRKYRIKKFIASERVFLAKEFVEKFEFRRNLPILIINLDGTFGYWDHTRETYIIRSKMIDSITTLSQDFTIVAVSNQEKVFIKRMLEQLQKLCVQDSTTSYPATFTQKCIVFDAVYRLRSEVSYGKMDSNPKYPFSSSVRNFENNDNNYVDIIQNDMTQIFLDYRVHLSKAHYEMVNQKFNIVHYKPAKFNPFHKVLIVTNQQYLLKNVCYSYDYNSLYQVTGHTNASLEEDPNRFQLRYFPQKHLGPKFSPTIITLPHLRLNHKITFEPIHKIIFTLLQMAFQNSKIVIQNAIIKNRLHREMKERIKKQNSDASRSSSESLVSPPSQKSEEPQQQDSDENSDQKQKKQEQKEKDERDMQIMLEDQIMEEIDSNKDEQLDPLLKKYHHIPNKNILKKLLNSNFKKFERKIKQNKIQQIRTIDSMQITSSFEYIHRFIDFTWAYKILNNHINQRRLQTGVKYDWMKLKQYRLIKKNIECEQTGENMYGHTHLQLHSHQSYVSNIDSTQAKLLRELHQNEREEKAAAPKKLQPNHEDAKNLYLSLLSQNKHIVRECFTYKQQYLTSQNQREKRVEKEVKIEDYFQEEQQATPSQQKEEEKKEESPQAETNQIQQINEKIKVKQEKDKKPVINDRDYESSLSEDSEVDAIQDSAQIAKNNHSSRNPKFDGDNPSLGQVGRNVSLQSKGKSNNYQMKYRVIQIKFGEVADNDTNTNLTVAQTGDMDLKQFVLISLKKEIHEQVASDTVNYDELTQIFSSVVQQKKWKNYVIDLLSTKQRQLPYYTNQDCHLMNNLSQLVGGEQQYYDMMFQLSGEKHVPPSQKKDKEKEQEDKKEQVETNKRETSMSLDTKSEQDI